MKRWQSKGWSCPKIANRRNEPEVLTAQGGTKRHPSTVRGVLERTRRRARREQNPRPPAQGRDRRAVCLLIAGASAWSIGT